MANNSIYIVNNVSRQAMMLAKSSGRGWEIRCTPSSMERHMSIDDLESIREGGPSNLVLMTEAELPADVDIVMDDTQPLGWRTIRKR